MACFSVAWGDKTRHGSAFFHDRKNKVALDRVRVGDPHVLYRF